MVGRDAVELRLRPKDEAVPKDGTGHLFFTDIPADRIYKTNGTKLSVFVEPAGHCNGLMIDGSGRILACSMDGALAAFDARSGKKTVLVAVHDNGTKTHPFPHALVAGIERYPSQVTRRMSKARQAKRSKVKPFVKAVNCT